MFSEAKPIKEIVSVSEAMYRKGWNEYNGGNISLLLDQSEAEEFGSEVMGEIELPAEFPELSGRMFAITRSGSCFRLIKESPERDIGVLRISCDGRRAELVAGFCEGGRPTSELVMHLGAHRTRLSMGNQRAVLHCHPADVIAMTTRVKPDSREFTRKLWGMMTECAVLFPEGVGLIGWQLSSSTGLGLKSAEYFRDHRAVVWAMHGVTCAGASVEEAFGIIETVDKAASIWLKAGAPDGQCGISPAQVKTILGAFGLKAKDGWLD